MMTITPPVRRPLLALALLGVLAGAAAAQQPRGPAPGGPSASSPAPAASPLASPPAASPPAASSAPVLPAVGSPIDSTVIAPNAAARASLTQGMSELSPWSMFLAADIVVKAVMVGLMIASLVTWTVFLGKTVELAIARRRLSQALRRLSGATTMSEAKLALGSAKGLLSGLLVVTADELELSAHTASEAGVKERGESRVLDLVRAEGQTMRRGMGLLATIGSTAPFVGLFGTVWGIMNSFIGISKSQTTNLAVVAPGIAEALLATAIGLVAAIPAVIIYNHFSRETRSYQLLVNRAASAVGRLLSRELDRRRLGGAHRVAK